MSAPRQPVRVVAALIGDGQGRYLVQRRLPDKSRPNLWEFPGGKVEPGETDEAALVRECREELAVDLRVTRQLWSTVHTYPDFSVELVLYGASIAAGQPQALGAQALRFATPEQMRELPFCEADVPLLEVLAAGRLG